MTKILLLGSDGLLGSCLEVTLREDPDLNLITTARKIFADNQFTYSSVTLRKLIKEIRPNVVINCIVTTSPKNSILTTFMTNSVLPINLALLSIVYKLKVIHFGTNAVFSGRRINNYETSAPVPRSIYEITKLVGDLSSFKNLVIRTSFIGSSPNDNITSGLVFRLQNLEKDVKFEILDNFTWNGVTTDVLCEMVLGIIKNNTHTRGLIHLGCKDSLHRHSLIKSLLSILHREDIEITTITSERSRNLTLRTRKSQLVSVLWSYSSFPEIPEVYQLLNKMKIYKYE